MGFTVPIVNRDYDDLKSQIQRKIQEEKWQKRLVLIIVSTALLLDNMLYMVIVPIIPDYLRRIGAYTVTYSYEQVNETESSDANMTSRMRRVKEYQSEDQSLGNLFASKAIVQLLVNPFSGMLIDRIGYEIPMIIGLVVMFSSTAIFALGQSYGVLFFARSLQDTSGLAMIANRFPEETERSRSMGIALAFISFGSLVAPPFGGTLYQFAGKPVPFLVLSFVCLLDGFMVFMLIHPKTARTEMGERVKGPNVFRLLLDPYIATCAGALVTANISLAFLEPTIAKWMTETMPTVTEWQIGLVWLPPFIPHLLGVYSAVRLMKRYPRLPWFIAAVGLGLEGISCFIVPFTTNYTGVIIPLAILCYGIALVDTALLPLLGYLVDTRHASVYGSVYAIVDISYSLAYAIGPIVAGGIVASHGFFTLNLIICLSNVLYAPTLSFIKTVYTYKTFDNEEAPFNNFKDDGMPKSNVYGSLAEEPGYSYSYDDIGDQRGMRMNQFDPFAGLATRDNKTASSTFPTNNLTSYSNSYDSRGQNRENMEQFVLQSPPVPDLSDTLAKYLNYVKVLCDQETFAKVKNELDDFASREGPELQTELKQIAMREKNWITPFWIRSMYLGNRLPLPVYSNPGFALPNVVHHSLQDYFNYVATFIHGVFDFKSLIDRKAIAPEYSTGRIKPQKLSMGQFWDIFTAYRQANYCMDILEIQEKTMEPADEHATVMCKNMPFILPVVLKGKIRSLQELSNDLSRIVELANAEKHSKDLAIGAVTMINRDRAALAYQSLQRDETNKRSLNAIKRCTFVVCLDEAMSGKETKDPLERSLVHMITGGGPKYSLFNRWFEKTFQFILTYDGGVGVNYEHTVADGAPLITLMEHVSFRLHGRPLCTYESASMRRFFKGRVENLRAATPQALQWVETMENKNASKVKSAYLIKSAPIACGEIASSLDHLTMDHHYQLMQEVVTGYGIDNHLIALKEIAQQKYDKMPDFFSNQQFDSMFNFRLSTSQVTLGILQPIHWLKCDRVVGYGPVVEDGYGCAYKFSSENMLFFISSMKSCKETDSCRFRDMLTKTLDDMRTFTEAVCAS
ncbi:vesicular acetylcholine transporter unc 17 [Trichuris trichiura]|uniref:Vesicular acetylcholine transporter unc 17 n=1 Tax=Trichuris trichiura TaxID=36087 RepID=A0A077YVZ4_TRITR|nr:vesicular acetylcholine transporter unc 17 [Trichuris trichiura]